MKGTFILVLIIIVLLIGTALYLPTYNKGSVAATTSINNTTTLTSTISSQPVSTIDVSYVNLWHLRTEVWDFTFNTTFNSSAAFTGSGPYNASFHYDSTHNASDRLFVKFTCFDDKQSRLAAFNAVAATHSLDVSLPANDLGQYNDGSSDRAWWILKGNASSQNLSEYMYAQSDAYVPFRGGCVIAAILSAPKSENASEKYAASVMNEVDFAIENQFNP